LANIWKENVLEDLESGKLDYAIVVEFLADLTKNFSGRNNKTMKVAKFKKVEQGSRIIEKFV